MRFLTALICVLVCGVALGGAVTWLSVQDERGFGALRVGQWTAWPDAGSADADPYTDARIAVDGKVPLGAAEGVLFVAKHDGAGETLRRECDYRINGRLPAARYWTPERTRRTGTRYPRPLWSGSVSDVGTWRLAW